MTTALQNPPGWDNVNEINGSRPSRYWGGDGRWTMICQPLISTALDESFRNSTNSPQASPSAVREVNSLITTPFPGPGAGVGDGCGAGVGEGSGVGVGDGCGAGVGSGVGDGVGEGMGEGVGEVDSGVPGAGPDGTPLLPHPWTASNASRPTTRSKGEQTRVVMILAHSLGSPSHSIARS